MKHFEDIWNEAEAVASKFPEQTQLAELTQQIKAEIDKLPTVTTLEEQAEIIGAVLFSICDITRQLNMNSAAALQNSIDAKKSELLDPDIGD